MFEGVLQAADPRGCRSREELLIANPDSDRLKALSLEEPEVKQTKYGSIYAD